MRPLLLAALACALAACSTVEGVGRDVQGAGDFVSDTARKARQALSD
ncbi:MAG: entericidin A/B family lipoprotein [Pseudomonadota bacterium]